MQTVFRLLSLRYLLQRWDRSALIVASIALGVATLVSTRILNECIEAAATQSATPLGIGDLFITNGELGVNRPIADEVRAAAIDGIESVQPIVVDRVYLPNQDNRATVLIGAELAKHQLAGHDAFEALAGENPLKISFTRIDFAHVSWLAISSPRKVIISRSLYNEWIQRQELKHEPFLLRYGSRTLEYYPVGIVDYGDDSPLKALGPNIVGMEIIQAARFLRPSPDDAVAALVGGSVSPDAWDELQPPRVNRIDILLKPGADRAAVQARLESIVRGRALVRTPKEQDQNTQEIIGGIQLGFTLCSIGAMVVGLFLVYNSLAVTVAERRHDIGILRSIGATRLQIVAMFVLAAFVLGFIGSLLGIPLGYGLSQVALQMIQTDMARMYVGGEVPLTLPNPLTLLLAFVAGVGTAVFAALVPSLQAAYQDPADAVRRVPGGVGGAWRAAHRVVCMTLVAGGVAMVLSRHELPPRVGAFGGMVFALVGMLLAAPILVGILVKFLQPLLRQVLPIEARLAADNLIRSPGRTGLVIGALAAGVAVMIQTAGVGRSNEEPVTKWLDEIIQADQLLAAGDITEAISSQCPCDPEVIRQLKALPGVDAVAGIRYVRPEYNGTFVFMTAIDMDQFVDPSQARGPNGLPQLDKLRKLPNRDGVVISDNFAVWHKVKIGDTISLNSPNGPVKLVVLDQVQDYSWSRGTLFIDRAVYSRLFRDNQIDIAHVFVTHATEEARLAAKTRVIAFAADRGYITADRTALRKILGDIIERVYKLVHMQQVVVGLVAALGVITSLLISVLQRKRELGLLLAVGATPAQVIRTVLYEAVLMGLFGTVLGFFIGVPLEWYVVRVVLFEESGFVFDVILPWKQVFSIGGGAMLVATLAGLLPALRAVKTRIPEAIAYE